MGTITINVNEVTDLLAVNDFYTITDLINPTKVYPLTNDEQGVFPIMIISLGVISGTIVGTISIDPFGGDVGLIFTPNGSTGSMTFDYTIQDSLSRTSTTTVTITTS